MTYDEVMILPKEEEKFKADWFDGYEQGIQECIDIINNKYYHDGYDEDIVGVIIRILEGIKNDIR